MNRTQNTTEPVSKQSSIASISSNIPLLAMNTDNDATQSLINTTTDVESLLNPFKRNPTRDSKRGRALVQPKGTIPYTIGNYDTLEKIALQFNLTPSELLQLNKLNTRIVFPGQILYVPDAPYSNTIVEEKQQPTPTVPIITPSSSKPKDGDTFIVHTDRRLSSGSSPPSSQQDAGAMVWSMSRQSTAKPGRAQRLKSEASTESDSSSSRTIEERLKTHKEDNTKQVKQLQKTFSMEENHQLDEECLQRFIKVNVRLMTDDHKSVGGTLLVTPNAVMFDPDVLDSLVKEHGIDKYGLIIRMDLLAGIALYEDIAMYEHEANLRDEEKRKMCHSSSIKNIHQCSTTSMNNDEEQVHDLMSSLLDKIDKEFNSSIDTSRMLFNASSANQRRISTDNEDLFYSLDGVKHSSGILINDKDIPSSTYQLENCIPNDEFNRRFGEIDKLLQKQHEIYVTPHPIEIPYYLCIKTSRIANNVMPVYERSNKKMFDEVYGKKELEYEYWFSVPKEKIDHLYAFFLRWSPERALDPYFDDDHPDNSNTSLNQVNRHVSNSQSKQNEISSGKGFVLLANDDPELTDDYVSSNNKNNNSSKSHATSDSTTSTKKQHYLKRQNTLLKEWEIISVDEIYRRINATHANPTHTPDIGIPPPKLLQPSTLVDEEQSKQILLELPARVHGLNWNMIFSTETNGFSLNQLYRRSMEVDSDAPALLIVKDVEQNMFGAYISQQLMISEGFYGTGESFLFTFYPKFQVFHWTGNNQFFVKGDVKTLGIGSGEGTYGLWLDADLYHGRTCPSKTFNNVRLSSKEDFIIASVEVWTFID
ncbi:unnamed protein product [Adineta steineri]|uniref:Oxidation resistance protein 1 n=1 Tax=Adineta steineri TaxID=433720 RepID=A0A815JH37_9BILA|nr:unnamed protein product [Adineta steineri]CAF1606834.1 unnamed protein product [Adineta steineri]